MQWTRRVFCRQVHLALADRRLDRRQSLRICSTSRDSARGTLLAWSYPRCVESPTFCLHWLSAPEQSRVFHACARKTQSPYRRRRALAATDTTPSLRTRNSRSQRVISTLLCMGSSRPDRSFAHARSAITTALPAPSQSRSTRRAQTTAAARRHTSF